MLHLGSKILVPSHVILDSYQSHSANTLVDNDIPYLHILGFFGKDNVPMLYVITVLDLVL